MNPRPRIFNSSIYMLSPGFNFRWNFSLLGRITFQLVYKFSSLLSRQKVKPILYNFRPQLTLQAKSKKDAGIFKQPERIRSYWQLTLFPPILRVGRLLGMQLKASIIPVEPKTPPIFSKSFWRHFSKASIF